MLAVVAWYSSSRLLSVDNQRSTRVLTASGSQSFVSYYVGIIDLKQQQAGACLPMFVVCQVTRAAAVLPSSACPHCLVNGYAHLLPFGLLW